MAIPQGGAFLTSRELFGNPIWKNIVEFRLFFLIYGNAAFAEVRISDDLILQRGQWLRSTRKIQEDLQYIENQQVKIYSSSTISRTIQRLVRSERVHVRMHNLGTVFTVLNYEQYQGFGHYKQTDLGTDLGTPAEHPRNNNKNVKNVIKKDLKIYREFKHLSMTFDEFERLLSEGYSQESIDTILDRIENYKNNKNYVSLILTARNWLKLDAKKSVPQSKPKDKGIAFRNKEIEFQQFMMGGGNPDEFDWST